MILRLTNGLNRLWPSSGIPTVSFLFVVYWVFSPALAVAHAGYERSLPAANARLPSGQAPGQVQIWFTERIEIGFSEITVLDRTGGRVDLADSRGLPGEFKGLEVRLKTGLPDGPYTVVFKNASSEDGHIVKGSFAFLVGAGELPSSAGVSPLDVALQGNPTSADNANFWSITLRWLNYLAGAVLVGGLSFSLLVWPAAARRAKATKRMGQQLDKAYLAGLYRATMAMMYGLAGLLAGWLGWFIYQAGAFSGQTPWQLLGLGATASGSPALIDFLTGSRYGLVWLARLGLLIVLTIVWLAAWRSFNKMFVKPAAESDPLEAETASLIRLEGYSVPGLWWVTLAIGAGVLFTNSLNSHAASVTGWTWLAIAGDWLHLLSTAVWVGGLVALSLALSAGLPVLLPSSGDRTRLLAALIPAFSQLAIISVMVLLITGTLNAALQLGDASELFSSGYGIVLTIKLTLLVPLLLLAAYNLLVVTPRMRIFARTKKAGPQEGAGSLAAGKLGLSFRRSVLFEIVVVGLVILAAAVLTSFAPPRSAGRTGALYYVTEQSGLKVELAISPGVIGENSFEVRLVDLATGRTVQDAALVDLHVSMREMDMGNPRLELKPTSSNNGRYFGQGPIFSMSGTWDIALLVQRIGKDDVRVPVTFKLK